MKKNESSMGSKANYGCAVILIFIALLFFLPIIENGVPDDKNIATIMIIVATSSLLLSINFLIKGRKSHQEFQKMIDQQKKADEIKKKADDLEKIKSQERERQRAEQEKLEAQQRNNKLNRLKYDFNKKHKKKGSGFVEIIDYKNEFDSMVQKHQDIIKDKGKEYNENYNLKFVKLANYIQLKNENIKFIFNTVDKVDDLKDFRKLVSFFESEMHTYNLILLNSFNLVVSLIDDDQFTFYKIYERFDKLNIFNSNWENEVKEKLINIESNIEALISEVNHVGRNIVNSINDLTYITAESSERVNNKLKEIDSSIQVNNLLTLINTYQNYKTNKNTKSLR